MVTEEQLLALLDGNRRAIPCLDIIPIDNNNYLLIVISIFI
jgi:hypothetical protein